MASFPCPLCRTPLGVRISKKSKPYVVCNSCGVQVFIRGAEGIARLARLTRGGRLQVPARRAVATTSRKAGPWDALLGSPAEEPDIHPPQVYTGPFHCPRCLIQEEVEGEVEWPHCEQCGRRMARGRLRGQ